jgi:DNA-binding NarL/FixJ family response regulator
MASNRCVLLADSHHGLSEGVRRLLATLFDAIVMVADEVSLFETANRLQSDLVVVDLTLARGDALGLLRRFRSRFPDMKVIVVSNYDSVSVSHSVLAAGAHAFVVKSAIATDLLAAADNVLAGKSYVSPRVV